MTDDRRDPEDPCATDPQGGEPEEAESDKAYVQGLVDPGRSDDQDFAAAACPRFCPVACCAGVRGSAGGTRRPVPPSPGSAVADVGAFASVAGAVCGFEVGQVVAAAVCAGDDVVGDERVVGCWWLAADVAAGCVGDEGGDLVLDGAAAWPGWDRVL